MTAVPKTRKKPPKASHPETAELLSCDTRKPIPPRQSKSSESDERLVSILRSLIDILFPYCGILRLLINKFGIELFKRSPQIRNLVFFFGDLESRHSRSHFLRGLCYFIERRGDVFQREDRLLRFGVVFQKSFGYDGGILALFFCGW